MFGVPDHSHYDQQYLSNDYQMAGIGAVLFQFGFGTTMARRIKLFMWTTSIILWRMVDAAAPPHRIIAVEVVFFSGKFQIRRWNKSIKYHSSENSFELSRSLTGTSWFNSKWPADIAYRPQLVDQSRIWSRTILPILLSHSPWCRLPFNLTCMRAVLTVSILFILFRYQLFLQVKQDVLQGRLPVSFELAAELGAYIVQCKYTHSLVELREKTSIHKYIQIHEQAIEIHDQSEIDIYKDQCSFYIYWFHVRFSISFPIFMLFSLQFLAISIRLFAINY